MLRKDGEYVGFMTEFPDRCDPGEVDSEGGPNRATVVGVKFYLLSKEERKIKQWHHGSTLLFPLACSVQHYSSYQLVLKVLPSDLHILKNSN